MINIKLTSHRGHVFIEYMTRNHMNTRDILHREDGPAIERLDGTKEWYLNNRKHRSDGPATIRKDGTKEWFRNGIRHRLSGPAIEWGDGRCEYWYDGQFLRSSTREQGEYDD